MSASHAAAAAADTHATTCKYCVERVPHPQFVSLLIDGRLTPADLLSARGPPSGSVLWDFSRQPLVNLNCHARKRRYRIGPKASKFMAPYIRHALVIGPFHGGASLFVRVLKDRCRRWRQKMTGSVALARRWHLLDPTRQRGVHLRVFASEKIKEVIKSAVSNSNDDSDSLEQAARMLVAAAAAPTVRDV
jgi:hypothetical protein